MEDKIKKLFHRKSQRIIARDARSIRTLPYHAAPAGAPPRQGNAPLHGEFPSDPAEDAQPANASTSAIPDTYKRSHQRSKSARVRYEEVPPMPPHPSVRLRRTLSDAARNDPSRMAANARADVHQGTADNEMAKTNSDPLPGTALTSDDARYSHRVDGNGYAGSEQLPLGRDDRLVAMPSRLRYGDTGHVEERANRNQVDPPSGRQVDPEPDGNVGHRRVSESQEYDGEMLSAKPVDGRAGDGTFRKSLDDDADSDRSASPLRRKRGLASGLRNVTDPTHERPSQLPYTVQPSVDGGQTNGAARSYLVKDSAEPVSLEGVVDLRDTENTTYHERYAPAVTHETVYPEVHNIREERIFREIHTHDIHHRILPIIDVEVRPARHFVPEEDGRLREVPEEAIPGRSVNNAARNWLIAETVSKLPKNDPTPKGPRRFTAREFPGEEGDEVEYVTEDGIARMETTWVHPPIIADGARQSGQTEPLYMGSPESTPKQYGWHRNGITKEDEQDSQTPLKDLTGGIHNMPFDECVEFERKEIRGLYSGLAV